MPPRPIKASTSYRSTDVPTRLGSPGVSGRGFCSRSSSSNWLRERRGGEFKERLPMTLPTLPGFLTGVTLENREDARRRMIESTDLIDRVRAYQPAADIDLLKRAYDFS